MRVGEAASTIFALTAVLPLLLFVYFIWRFGLMESTEAQFGIFLALVVALLGFVLFRRLTARFADLGRALGQAVSAPAAELGAGPAGLVSAAGAKGPAAMVPGLGQLSEIGEIAQAFGHMLAELRASTERLEDLVFKLGTLNDMVEMAARIPRIEDLLSHVLERSMRAVSASVGSIMLLDRESQTLRIAVGRGLQETGRLVEVKVGEGIAGRVAEIGEAVLVEDIEKDPRFGQTNDPRYGNGSFICLPLRVAERIVGVVNLAKKEIAPGTTVVFSHTDLQFLNALATYTAYAVDNARLFEAARQAAQRLQEVVEDQKLRLTLAQQQMIQAAKLSALGELVAGVAHELNNPLTVLVGVSDLLQELAPTNLRAHVQMIREATSGARHVVRGLLTFGRRMPLERRHVALDELIEAALTLAAADLRLGRVTVDRDVATDLPRVWADGHQIQQVLVNLVTNAKQAMDELPQNAERRLRITARALAADRVRISVEDTGPGIPADVLPKIFDPFVTTKGSAGTGLGLSISYGIIREHGGQTTAESQPGRGASFTIELPVGAAVDGALTAPGSQPPRLDGKRILIVEHDQAVRKVLLEHLEPTGCTALTVFRPDEVRDQLREGVDLVVADFNLEGIDWLALMRENATRGAAGGCFIFVAARPLGEEADAALRDAGTRLLYKPFTRDQFLDAVRSVTG
ncbi:MAG: ATP-binding protein [Candidatus Rokuibacteriota bacterium]